MERQEGVTVNEDVFADVVRDLHYIEVFFAVIFIFFLYIFSRSGERHSFGGASLKSVHLWNKGKSLLPQAR